MDDNNKEQFRNLLHDKFNNTLKEVNEALVKHIERIERTKRETKSAYQKIKIMKNLWKKKDYDKQYYTEHKQELLNNRKDKYNNENEKLSFQIDGRINLIKNQINFERIESENYFFPKNDLKYIKDLFEVTVLNKGVFKIFQREKIKNFILQISWLLWLSHFDRIHYPVIFSLFN